jgi:hypothetical protein
VRDRLRSVAHRLIEIGKASRGRGAAALARQQVGYQQLMPPRIKCRTPPGSLVQNSRVSPPVPCPYWVSPERPAMKKDPKTYPISRWK